MHAVGLRRGRWHDRELDSTGQRLARHEDVNAHAAEMARACTGRRHSRTV